MATRLEKVVVSGPNRKDEWFWRPADGGETLPVPEHLVDLGWVNAQTVEMQVRRKGSTIELVGPPEQGPEALLYVDGEPYIPPDTLNLEPGVVVWALVSFGARDEALGPDRSSKRRPAVVTQVHDDYVVIRPAFGNNAKGRGRRLQDPEPAGLTGNSIVGDDEVVVDRKHLGRLVGTLSEFDRKWVLR